MCAKGLFINTDFFVRSSFLVVSLPSRTKEIVTSPKEQLPASWARFSCLTRSGLWPMVVTRALLMNSPTSCVSSQGRLVVIQMPSSLPLLVELLRSGPMLHTKPSNTSFGRQKSLSTPMNIFRILGCMNKHSRIHYYSCAGLLQYNNLCHILKMPIRFKLNTCHVKMLPALLKVGTMYLSLLICINHVLVLHYSFPTTTFHINTVSLWFTGLFCCYSSYRCFSCT